MQKGVLAHALLAYGLEAIKDLPPEQVPGVLLPALSRMADGKLLKSEDD
jgi:hypothetical protein